MLSLVNTNDVTNLFSLALFLTNNIKLGHSSPEKLVNTFNPNFTIYFWLFTSSISIDSFSLCSILKFNL